MLKAHIYKNVFTQEPRIKFDKKDNGISGSKNHDGPHHMQHYLCQISSESRALTIWMDICLS